MPESALSTVRLFTPSLLTLPPELLENIAFYYICPRLLGPPISLTPLLLTSKSLYRNLTNAKHLYARVFKYKFSFSAILRRGFEPGAREWASQLRSWCKVLRSVRRRRRRPEQEQFVDELCDDIGMEEPDVQETMYTLWLMCLEDDGCNRLQMQISGVYEWVEGYIHREMYKVLNKGWPIANAANSCAMWILWYLSSKDRLLEESQPQRETLIELVLPFLTVPFRYPGAFAPANHFRLPFNASALPSFCFSEPTITAHGPFPIYLHPSSHTWNLPHFDRWTSLSTPLAADAAKLVYFSRRETMPFPVPDAFPRNREEHRERVRALLAAENDAAGGHRQVSEYELDMMLQNELPRPTQEDFLELNDGLLGGAMVDDSASTRSSPYKCKGGGTALPCTQDRWDDVRRVLPSLLDSHSPSFAERDLDEAERILFSDEYGRGYVDESACQSRRWDTDWWRLRLCRSCWVNRAGLDDAPDRDESEQRGTSEEADDIVGSDNDEDVGEEEGEMDENDLAVTEQLQDGKMSDYDADTDTETVDTGIHDSYDNDTERSPTLLTGYPQKGALYTPGALNGLWTGRMVIPSESDLRALLLPPAPADPLQGNPLPLVNQPDGPAPNMPPPPDNQNPTPPPPLFPAAAADLPPANANANPATVAQEIGQRPGTFTEDTLGLVAVPLYVRLKEYAVYNGGKVVPCAADTDIIAGEDDDDLDANLSFGSGPGSSSTLNSGSGSGSSPGLGGVQGEGWSGGPGPGYPTSHETFDQGIADAWFPQFSTLSTSASAGARGGGGGGRDKLVVSVPAQSLPPRAGGRGGRKRSVGVEEYEYVAVDEKAVARAVDANGDADADESIRIPGTFHDRETCSGCRAREEALRAIRARDEGEAQFGHLSTSSDTSPATRSGSGGIHGSSLPDSTMEEPESDSDSDLPPYVPSPSTIPACNGIRDVIITGTSDARHANAWGKWAWKGRVRKWDGLIGMIREPALDGPSGLAPGSTGGAGKIFFYGTLLGGKNFVGTWRMANQDPRMPAYEGAFTLGRKEEEGE